MKKLFTSLLLGASLLSFGREGGVNYEWVGAIKNGQHMNTASITSDDTGNLFVGMNLKSTVDVDLTSGVNSLSLGSYNSSVITSYTSDKAIRWTKAFSGSESRITDVTLGMNGEIVVTGYFKTKLQVSANISYTGSASQWNGYVVKLDANGDYISGMSFNANAQCIVYGTEVDASGNIYVTGYTSGDLVLDQTGINPITISATKKTGFTVKYDASFSYQWSVVNSGMDIENRSMAQNADYIFVSGNHVAGTMQVSKTGSQTTDLTNTATKTGGHVIAIKKSDGTSTHFENIAGTSTTHIGRKIQYSKIDESLVISGEFIGNLTIDNQSITGHSSEKSGFATKLMIAKGSTDLLAHTWTKTLRHSNTGYPITLNDISVSPIDGSIYMATTTRRGIITQLFQNGSSKPTESLIPYNVNTNNDAATVYLDKNSTTITAARFGNTSNSLAQSAHITTTGKLVMGGWFRAATDFDPGVGTVNVDGGTTNSVFLAQYSMLPVTNRIYVDDNKNGNGISWNEAFSTITAAFNVAQAGDTILVAEGTYTALNANQDVKLWGGYVGNETDLTKRDAKANQTIINGNGALHALTISSSNLVIDGFVITGGKQTASGTGNNVSGAGVFYSFTTGNGNLVIKNCDIKDNQGFSQGAGLYVNVEGSGTFNVKVENTRISGNNCRYAQSWQAKSLGTSTLNFDFVNNLVTGNFSKNQGGNWTGYKAGGGGMITAFGTSVLNANIINSTITKNTYQGTETKAGDALIAVSQEIAGSPTISLNVYNSILFGNESTNPIGYWENGTSYEKLTNLVMRNNITEITTSSTYASANTSIVNNDNNDPLFTDAANNDFTLAANSPAIDMGDDTGINTMIPSVDLAGKQRIAGTKIDLGAYEANSITVNTFESEETTISVYPNPSSSIINIDAEVISVSVLNTNGQVVATSTESIIDVSNLATGLYFLQIQTENGVYSAKITKQ